MLGAVLLQDDAGAHLMTQLHQALSSVVRLERYLKSTIDVCVLVLEDDGGKAFFPIRA